jgi:hypothetical protein
MRDPWQILHRAGLPMAGERTGDPPSEGEIAEALSAVLVEDVAPRERDALVAFVDAWRQHWPSSFARALGDRAPAVTRWATAHPVDEGRRLKLRRIALANLAHTL